MLKKYLVTSVVGLSALALLASCGSGDKAQGTGEFATVTATASGPGGPLDSDVATWVDAVSGAATQPCLSTSVGEVSPDTVDYSISVVPYTSTTTTTPVAASRVQISRVTVTLDPANTATPPLPPIYQTQFVSSALPIIEPGSSLTVPVRIVPNELKIFLRSDLGAASLSCSNPAIYQYRAVVSFEAVEVNTNRGSTITAPGYLIVNFADFADSAGE